MQHLKFVHILNTRLTEVVLSGFKAYFCFTPVLVTFLIFLSAPTSRAANSCAEVFNDESDQLTIAQIVEYQKIYKRPNDFFAFKRVQLNKENGESQDMFVTRTYNSGLPGVALSFPRTGIASFESGPVAEIVKSAYKKLAQEYLSGEHNIDLAVGKRIAEDIQKKSENLKESFDNRTTFYAVRKPFAKMNENQFSGFLMLHDGSSYDGKIRHTSMENILMKEYGVSEQELRSCVDCGVVELFHAFNSSEKELRDLKTNVFLLKEAATYIDIQFLQRNRPAKIRVLAWPSRARLYQRIYGFKPVKEFGRDGKIELIWLELAGEEFVQRYGSNWLEWKYASQSTSVPASSLSEPQVFQNQVEYKIAKAKREYDFYLAQLKAGHAVSVYSDSPPLKSPEELGTFWSYLSEIFELDMDHLDYLLF